MDAPGQDGRGSCVHLSDLTVRTAVRRVAARRMAFNSSECVIMTQASHAAIATAKPLHFAHLPSQVAIAAAKEEHKLHEGPFHLCTKCTPWCVEYARRRWVERQGEIGMRDRDT